ncbi:anti-sigma factor [Psychroflexus sp. MES1-P1E]|uniref:anti-sigma factor n=1 Tax=Psychroflexus sp. MES1-P1E TaxID=2058320 RepID=UPI000C7A62D3|nr:anti-sigma factor [Psychroflexus sp. MES1-P1E]PKG43584.1 anti-sigma factor [Psychroflexus sp. MES1-P1E]
MDTKDYIESGLLELYVYGALSPKEQAKIAQDVAKDPELQAEVESIETILLELSKATSPVVNPSIKELVVTKLRSKSFQHKPKVKIITSNYSYFGWAAAILLLGGILWLLKLNQDLQNDIEVVNSQLEMKEVQVTEASQKVETLEELFLQMGDPSTRKLTLPGNKLNSPNSSVVAFYTDEKEQLILDISRLPEAPEGMVYQAWSLKFEPLTPKSIGLLAETNSSENRVFRFKNVPESEGFGITLEPAGGSEQPNLKQLYALGTI